MRSTILLDGAFDPLHAGHVSYIHAARKAFPDDSIVVAVASDDDIRAKGREPLFDQQTRADVVGQIKGVDSVFIKYQPTENVIAALKPCAYVKGKDWEGRLPDAQVLACSEAGTQIVFLSGETRDSSTAKLERWALAQADRSLDRLEAFMAAQSDTPPASFDEAYYRGDWRSGDVYRLEDRRRIEGEHPDRIAACFAGLDILDVGCGPGYLVTLMKERGLRAGGIDTSRDAIRMSQEPSALEGTIEELPDKMCDVAICREVLEHLTVHGVGVMIAGLFRVARKFVYITTRFTDRGVFEADTDFETDPTHISLLSQPFIRALCVLEGGKRRRDLEATLDHMNKGRVLVYEV